MERSHISVALVTAESPLFENVVALGNANSRTLGFLPRGAFFDAAVENRLLAALDTNEHLAGYVLYRTSGQRAMIVHLCVDPAHRRRGITKILVNDLLLRLRHLDGLGLWCEMITQRTHCGRSLGSNTCERDEVARFTAIRSHYGGLTSAIRISFRLQRPGLNTLCTSSST